MCTLHGLTTRLGERTLVPALQSVRIGRHADVLGLRVVTGQSITDWQKRAPALAAAWRAERLTIRASAPGQLRIIIGRGDVLGQPIAVPMPTPASAVDLAAVRVGVTESRTWWHVPVLGQHILVAGATGAGKGSVLWSLIAGLQPTQQSAADTAIRCTAPQFTPSMIPPSASHYARTAMTISGMCCSPGICPNYGGASLSHYDAPSPHA